MKFKMSNPFENDKISQISDKEHDETIQKKNLMISQCKLTSKQSNERCIEIKREYIIVVIDFYRRYSQEFINIKKGIGEKLGNYEGQKSISIIVEKRTDGISRTKRVKNRIRYDVDYG